MKFFLIIAVVVILALLFGRKKAASSSQSEPNPVIVMPSNASDLEPVQDYISNSDPDFVPSAFTEKVSNLFLRYFYAIEDKSPDGIRAYLSDGVLSDLDKEISDCVSKRVTHRFEKLTVLSCDILGKKTDGDFDVLVTKVRSRISDYYESDESDQISGDRGAEKFYTYEIALSRKTGEKTGKANEFRAQNCPSCGAPVNINNDGRCEYCGSILKTDPFGWKISDMKIVSYDEA